MKEFILKFQVGDHKVDFKAPIEMIYAGFKISYLVPEELSSVLAEIVKENIDSSLAEELQYNDCLEEILLSMPGQRLKLIDEDYTLEFLVTKNDFSNP